MQHLRPGGGGVLHRSEAIVWSYSARGLYLYAEILGLPADLVEHLAVLLRVLL